MGKTKHKEESEEIDIPTQPYSCFTEDGKYIVLQSRDEEHYTERLKEEYGMFPATPVSPVQGGKYAKSQQANRR